MVDIATKLSICISAPGISDHGERNSTYEMVDNDTILDLKKQIASKMSTTSPDQSTIDRHVLIFRGRILQNDQNLGEIISNIGAGIETRTPTFHLVIKPLRGSNDYKYSFSQSVSYSSQSSSSSQLSSSSQPYSSASQPSSSAAPPSHPAQTPQPQTIINPSHPPHPSIPTINVSNTSTSTATDSPLSSYQVSQPSTSPNNLHTINLTFPINGSLMAISIPCYDLLWIPPNPNSNDDWAFCLSPVVIKKLLSLGVSLDPVALYAQDPVILPSRTTSINTDQPMPTNPRTILSPATVGRALARGVQQVRQHHNFLLLAIKLALVVDLLAVDRQLLYQYWPVILAVVVIVLWQSRLLDRHLGPIRRIVPSLQLHLPHALPATPHNYEDLFLRLRINGPPSLPEIDHQENAGEIPDIDEFIAQAQAQQQRTLLQSIQGGFYMLIGSFIPSIYDSWLREDRERRNRHNAAIQDLRRKLERRRTEVVAAEAVTGNQEPIDSRNVERLVNETDEIQEPQNGIPNVE